MPSRPQDQEVRDVSPSLYAIESMLYLAYTVSKQFPPLLSSTECEVDLASFDANRAFLSMNGLLDDIEAAGERFAKLSLSMEFMSARVYINAMCYVNELLKRARLPALKGDDQLRDARAARDALRERLAKLDRDSGLVPAVPVPRRGNNAREVAAELLEVAKYGHEVRLRPGADSAPLHGALFVARLTAEELLTALGELDAPPLILQLRSEQREACKQAIMHWGALRELVQPLCLDAAERERLAPRLPA